MENQNDFFHSPREEKGQTILEQCIKENLDADTLVAQLIQVLRECHNLNDLRFVVDLYDGMQQQIGYADNVLASKLKKVVRECEVTMQRIKKKYPEFFRNVNKFS